MGLVARSLRATARGLPVVTAQPDRVTGAIQTFMDLGPKDSARAYEMLADTYSPGGLVSDAQLAAYLDLLRATAGVPADVPVGQIVDLAIARPVAMELGLSAE